MPSLSDETRQSVAFLWKSGSSAWKGLEMPMHQQDGEQIIFESHGLAQWKASIDKKKNKT